MIDLAKAVQEKGFKSLKEFHELVANADISTPTFQERFKNWQLHDGSKEGLLKLSGNKENKIKQAELTEKYKRETGNGPVQSVHATEMRQGSEIEFYRTEFVEDFVFPELESLSEKVVGLEDNNNELDKLLEISQRNVDTHKDKAVELQGENLKLQKVV